MAKRKKYGVKRVTPCMHNCQKPVPATVFVRFHPFKPGYEVRRCFECGRDSAYPCVEVR